MFRPTSLFPSSECDYCPIAAVHRSPGTVTDPLTQTDYRLEIRARDAEWQVSEPQYVVIRGTAIGIRQVTRAHGTTSVRGRLKKTSQTRGIADTPVRLLANPNGGRDRWTRAGVTTRTNAKGIFKITYQPKKNTQYRVAMLNQLNLGGSWSRTL
jgi:hypothetical protein